MSAPTGERNQKRGNITVNMLKRPYFPVISVASAIYRKSVKEKKEEKHNTPLHNSYLDYNISL